MFRSQKPRADEVIFSEEKFQKPLLINFFAWEKKVAIYSRQDWKKKKVAFIHLDTCPPQRSSSEEAG